MTRKRKILITAARIGLLAALTGCHSKPQTDFQLGHLNSTAHLLGFVAVEEYK